MMLKINIINQKKNDMDSLSKICNMYFVNFEEFIMRFNPQNMIHILNELLYNLS